MDAKKVVATVVALGLVVAGALWKVDFKGMVCGDQPVQSAGK